MNVFWIGVLAYLSVGLLINALWIYTHFWSEGIDFTIDDMGPVLPILLSWPLILVIASIEAVAEYFRNKGGVLIPGSKSAKVERALRQ